MRFEKKILSGLAVATMALAPVAAQAGTRAGDSAVRVAPVAQAVTSDAGYAGREVSEENALGGTALIIAILALAAIVAGVVIASDDGSDGA